MPEYIAIDNGNEPDQYEGMGDNNILIIIGEGGY